MQPHSSLKPVCNRAIKRLSIQASKEDEFFLKHLNVCAFKCLGQVWNLHTHKEMYFFSSCNVWMPTTKFHRITEYDELKGTHKRATEYNSGLHREPLKTPILFLWSKCIFNSGRLGALIPHHHRQRLLLLTDVKLFSIALKATQQTSLSNKGNWNTEVTKAFSRKYSNTSSEAWEIATALDIAKQAPLLEALEKDCNVIVSGLQTTL